MPFASLSNIPKWKIWFAGGGAVFAAALLYVYFCGMLAGNLTHSMGGKVYLLLDPFPRMKGMAVAFTPPRGFNPELPFVKRIVGVGGDVISHDGRMVLLNGEPVAFARERTEGGDPLEMVAPGVIPEGAIFALGDAGNSFDSRFAWVGLIPRERVLGAGFALPFAPSARAADYFEDRREGANAD